MAAPIARQHLLKEKHDIEVQEEQLRETKEQPELQVEIAAFASSTSNGIESYFERGQTGRKTVSAEADPFSPLSVHGMDKVSQQVAALTFTSLEQDLWMEVEMENFKLKPQY